jgi:cell division protein FtsB
VTDGHRTSTIPRPEVSAAPARRSRGEKRLGPARLGAVRDTDDSSIDDSRAGLLRDFTTQIPRAKQILPQRHGRLIVGAFATLIALAIGAALFVLPVKSWMKQRDDLATRTGELKTLDAANTQLQSEVDRLQTDDGIREAAREEIDFVPGGEKRVTALPAAGASTVLPDGWPYNLVSSIIALRQAEAAAAAAPAPTVAPAQP